MTVVEWIAAAQRDGATCVIAPGAQIASLPLSALDDAIAEAAGANATVAARPDHRDVVEVAEWTDTGDVNNALATGRAILIGCAVDPHGVAHYVVGRLRGDVLTQHPAGGYEETG